MPEHYLHVELTSQIIGAFFEVYNELRSGLRERVYESALVLALRDRQIEVEQQVAIKVGFRGRPVGIFRADLVVAGKVLLELKALPGILPDHVAQTINALRATRLQVGLILNFGPQAQIRRVICSPKQKAPVR
jgi:GxxExxY protein